MLQWNAGECSASLTLQILKHVNLYYYGVVTYMSVDEVRSRIQNAYGIALSSNPSNWIQLEVGDSGFVRSVTIDGQKTVNGNAFSNVLGLRSPRFAYVCG